MFCVYQFCFDDGRIDLRRTSVFGLLPEGFLNSEYAVHSTQYLRGPQLFKGWIMYTMDKTLSHYKELQ